MKETFQHHTVIANRVEGIQIKMCLLREIQSEYVNAESISYKRICEYEITFSPLMLAFKITVDFEY